MFEECPADLQMMKVILRDGMSDENVYHCKVIRYNSEEESIYLLTGKTEITLFSLDSIYECTIHTQEGRTVCSGMIKERYWSKSGRVIVFRVQNGFYKNNLN